MNAKPKRKSKSLGFSLEAQHDHTLCGIDEVGRGPLAGPVLSCCVHIPLEFKRKAFWRDVTDSKKLSLAKREYLFEAIKEHSHYGIAIASEQEIDELNIHHATLLAMKRAYHNMRESYGNKPAHALIDGKFTPALDCAASAISKGDSKCISIAAASILAKVTRDRMMAAFAEEFPHYGWERNAGYGTPEHLNGIKEKGITKYHRRSFAPVRNALESA
jgi:ribonuclease HII